MDEKEKLIEHQVILKWASDIFYKMGLEAHDAKLIADALVLTSLWGIDSHGIARIPHYLTRFEKGSIKKKPDISFIKSADSVGQLNGQNGHGIIIMHKATQCAIELAKNTGVGVVGISNTSHCGAIGLYTRQITEADMVGIAFTHSDALVIPYGGKHAFFGTNPISIAFPTEQKEQPICLDMATSIVPWNYIMNAKRENSIIPADYGVDIYGNDTSLPQDVVAVKPLGGYKGYALAFLIDMLCGPLNGMNFGPHITPMYQNLNEERNLGSFVMAIDPSKFAGKDIVKLAGRHIISEVKLQGDHILFPGEPEYNMLKQRKTNGIPISSTMAAEFIEWSHKLNIPSPF
jgi:ureidoglycolate dehydrogenase (NAD+)